MRKKNFCLTILFYGVVFCTSIYSSERFPLNSKKYQLSICALFKNEASFLKEWIEYHRILGVEHFYLYNTGSIDSYHEVLSAYIKMKLVTLIQWPDFMGMGKESEEDVCKWALSTQISAYENAVKVAAAQESKWLVFLNVDEFLMSPNSGNIREILEKYDVYPGIVVGSNYFDASKKDFILPRRRLMLETLERVEPPKQILQKSVSKMIFKPDQCEGFEWPPYRCLFKKGIKPIALRKYTLHINRYLNRNEGYVFSKRQKQKLHLDHQLLSEEEKDDLLEQGYEIDEAQETLNRFIPHLLEKLSN